MNRTIMVSTLIAVTFNLAACDPKPKAEESATAAGEVQAAAKEAAPSAGDPSAEAAQMYTSTCVVCHGASGAGDGPGAAAMDPKPRNFGDKEWAAGVTDEELAKTIVGGGMAVGKSPLMPGNPGLKDKPDVVAELVKKVRSFSK